MSDIKLRLIGAALLIGGIWIAYTFGFQELIAAQNHSAEVHLNIKRNFLGPAGLIFGSFMLIFGRKGVDWIQTKSRGKTRLTIPGWVMVAVCVVVGIGFNEWLKASIIALGYQL